MKSIYQCTFMVIFLFILSGQIRSNAQALKIESSSLEVDQGSKQQTVKLKVISLDKSREIYVSILDLGEGSAVPGRDYSIQAPHSLKSTFTLNRDYDFSIVNIDILAQAECKSIANDIILRLRFCYSGNNNFADSILQIKITHDCLKKNARNEDEETHKRDEENHKIFGAMGRIDSTNTNKTEFCQYTDFLGFGNDKPNGIIQEEFLFKWALVKREFKISDNVYFQPFRSILLPSILFNRIEKGKDTSSLLYPVGYSISSVAEDPSGKKDTTLSPVMSSFDIMRYTSLKLEGKIVLMALRIKNARIYLDFNGSLIRNQITDTIINKNFTRSIYSFGSGLSIYVKSPIHLNTDSSFNIEAELGYYKLKLLDNYFKQYDVYALDNQGKKTIAFPIGESFNRASKPIWFTSIRLSKEWGKTSKNSVFVRFVYNFQKGSYSYYTKENTKVNSRTYYNNFMQIHLGVNLPIDGLFHN